MSLAKKNGFTILELLVVVILLGILGSVSIHLIFKNFFWVWWEAQGSLHIQGQAGEIIGKIEKDLKSCSRTSLGSYLLNGGFEELNNNVALNWEAAPPAEINFYVTGSTNVVHSGQASVGIFRAGSDISYTSDIFTLKKDATYLVTFWARSPALTTGEGTLIMAGSGAVLATISTASSNWTRLVLRYPAAGVLPGDLAVRIRLWARNVQERVYFDDISVTPIRAVLCSPVEAVNIEMSAAALTPIITGNN